MNESLGHPGVQAAALRVYGSGAFKAEIDQLTEQNGHDFEEAQFILESALDFAINDTRNEIYK